MRPTPAQTKARSAKAVLLATATTLALPAMAGNTEPPLEGHGTRLGSLETANVLPQGGLQLRIGTSQTNPNTAVTSGTGNQLYFGGGSYAVTDRLTFGFDFQSYRDPTINTIGGANPNFFLNPLSIWGKYQFVDNGRLKVAALASAEWFAQFDADLFGGVQSGVFGGSLKLPVSYDVSDAFQVTVTPSVVSMPDTVGGSTFYGTYGTVGVGASYRPTERLGFYGAVDVPVFGNNNIDSTGAFTQKPVWTVGARYNLTPRGALEAFVTNGVGMTPGTSAWTHWPDGDPLMFGVQLTYTPGADLPVSYRGPVAPVTARQVSLQQDGFTLGTADTIEPGVARISAYGGANGQWGAMLGFSPDRDGEIQLIVEDYADNSSLAAGLVPTTEPRYMIGPKLRLLDQNNGDPFSLSGRLLFGRQLDNNAGVGVFYLDALATYKVNDRLALHANPRLAAFGTTEVAAMGLGLNYEITEGLQLIAEASAVGLDATDPVWAAGLRYDIPGTTLSADAHATNAIGRFGIGNMLAQDEVRYGINISTTVDLGKLF